MPYGDYKLEAAKAGFDLSTDDGKIDYMKAAIAMISTMSPVEQEIYKKKLSKELNVSEVALDKELSGTSANKEQPRQERRYDDGDKETAEAEISPLERTLIKLFLTNDEFLIKIADHMEMLENPLAKRVYQLALSEKESKNAIDIQMIMDNLSIEDAARIQEILDQVLIDVNQDQVFNDCVSSWRTESLAKREHELITQLSLADEDNNEVKIKELTDELMEVQKQRKSLQNR